MITGEQGEIAREQEGSPERSSKLSGGVGADAASDATSAALLRVRVRVTTLT